MLGAAVGIIGFSFGVLVGYVWRDRISRQRRARYLAERLKREQWAAREREAAESTLATSSV
jgi:hypothetical protein